MSGRNSPPAASQSATSRRRSSISATMIDAFNNGRPSLGHNPTSPGPITTAAAQANRRRLSLSTIGLSGLSGSTQTSPFGSLHSRAESISSVNSSTVEESPFEEGDAPMNTPSSPFARRLSFGARALRDINSGGGNGGGGSNGDGFNLAENMRSRAERMSISITPSIPKPASPQPARQRERAKSVHIMEPPVQPQPVVRPKPQRPDAMQERILKGDFYMD